MPEQTTEKGRITQLLLNYKRGEKDAYNELFSLVYGHLRYIAQNQLARRPANKQLRKTELVHEAYLKLIDQSQTDWHDRAHFYAAAAKAMRHILVDHYRRQNAQKRGGGQEVIPMEGADFSIDPYPVQLLELHHSMEQLAQVDERMYTIVDLRFFAGMTIDEIARLLHISTSTVDRIWARARGWLYQQLA